MRKYLFLVILLVIPLSYAVDSDLDGIPDANDPYPLDYDNDGMPDSWETKNGLSFDRDNTLEDPDGDGLKNLDEFTYKTDPNSADTDGDEIPDREELEKGLNPLERNFRPSFGLILFVLFGAVFIAAALFFIFRKKEPEESPVQVMERSRQEALRNEMMRRMMVEKVKKMAEIKRQQKAFYNEGERKP
ncbi:MAG TPA: hypothetical protein VJI46_06625 [Candidatus Nanoarchaeia archaeon]|nr:hypothetical protein [Candidatus Nanoarchaeia archaeon]